MDSPAALAQNSASSPRTDDVLVSQVPATVRRDSEISAHEVPITPPMSPHQSDGGDDVITVDMDRRFLNVVQEVVFPTEAPASISNAPPRAYEAMETEQAIAVTPPQPPLR